MVLMQLRHFVLLFVSSSLWANQSEVIVDVKSPSFKNGILYTGEGGIIQNQDIRIQAKDIQYIRRGKTVHKVEAEGDLMVQYKGRVYVGSEFEYDFLTKTGTVFDGKTGAGVWYIGGDEIRLASDGSYTVDGASLTTCENQESAWDIFAKEVRILKEDLFEAKNVRFRLFQVPTVWLPSFKLNLKKFKEPIFRYTLDWDKGQGPRAAARYQLYSWSNFACYGRVEYRLRTGWGGAFETEYYPEDYPTTFVTRSYLGTDRLETAPDKMRRYRLQGAFHSSSLNGKTRTALTWDKYSDVRMPGDFKSDDFEVNTAGRTLFYIYHKETNLISSLKARPRVNSFESIKQDLPTGFATTKALGIGKTGILSTTMAKASFLDFDYSDKLATSLSDFQSGRIELKEQLFRPVHLGALVLTPQLGGTAIFYTTSQAHKSRELALLNYGLRAHLRAYRGFSTVKHVLEPYLEYKALTRPTVPPDDHYIFSIQDGYEKLQQVRLGVRNLLFSKKRLKEDAFFTADFYANAFFSDPVIPQMIPRLYLYLGWQYPSVHYSFYNAWNFQNKTLNTSIARCKWTINENIALTLEGRYRSKFDWRKADQDNFVLDVTRSQQELLSSPLSDRRITFLANLYFRLSPFWECHIQSHHGFFREDEKPYNEVKVDFFTWLSSAWKLRISYSHTDKDDRVTAGLSLIKK